MGTTVIICSANRRAILHQTVVALSKQCVEPDSIILSLSDEGAALPETKALPGVRYILGPKGLTLQRNTATPLIRTPYTLYLDDDVELAPDYIERMEQTFAQDPAICAATGEVVADGARDGNGIERRVAIDAVLKYRGERACVPVRVKDFYGCNMFVRSDVLRTERFDERLPLYGWLEDRDFGWRCKRHGKIVLNHGAAIAHLGTRTGRISDVKYGYSKIANPWYLWRKSATRRRAASTHASETASLRPLPSTPVVSTSELLMFWVQTTIANAFRALMPKRPQGADYKQRLRGNLMAYWDLLFFRIDPQNALKIPDSTSTAEQTREGAAWRPAPRGSTQ